MPNRAYQKGTRAEYLVRDALRRSDWVVMRSFGSKGPFDLMAIKKERTSILVGVKSHSGWMSPAQRASLIAAAAACGARPISAHYEGGAITYIDLGGEPWRP